MAIIDAARARLRAAARRLAPSRLGWTIGISVLGGILAGVVVSDLFVRGYEYAWPSRPINEAQLSDAFVDGGFIKVPFDIDRRTDCLASSTILLRRMHDYGPPNGVREDLVTLGLYNTTITDVGRHDVMLWFQVPPSLPPGEWDYDSRTQDDCDAGLFARRPSRPEVVRPLMIPDRTAIGPAP